MCFGAGILDLGAGKQRVILLACPSLLTMAYMAEGHNRRGWCGYSEESLEQRQLVCALRSLEVSGKTHLEISVGIFVESCRSRNRKTADTGAIVSMN